MGNIVVPCKMSPNAILNRLADLLNIVPCKKCRKTVGPVCSDCGQCSRCSNHADCHPKK